MALGSAAVVLAAVVLVAAIALVTVVVSFNAYQSAQLTSETNRTIGHKILRASSIRMPCAMRAP